jgi:hypothetical protein
MQIAQRRGARVPLEAVILGEPVLGHAAQAEREGRALRRVERIADRREDRQRVQPAREEDRDQHGRRRAGGGRDALLEREPGQHRAAEHRQREAARKARRLRPVPAGAGMPDSMPRRPRPAWAWE